MLARSFYLVAALAWLSAMLGLGKAERFPASEPVNVSGELAGLLYLPDRSDAIPDESGSVPVVILCHGRSGNAGSMSYLARQLARAGYAALAMDLRGHGRSSGPVSSVPRLDVERVLDWLPERRELDTTRVALLGHAWGAVAALEQAQWDSARVSSLILLAPSRDPGAGAYPAPSTLVLWGDGDAPRVREVGRAIGARLTGQPRVVGGRVYGDPRRGDGVRVDELSGPGPWSILRDRAVVVRVLDWLDISVSESGRSDGRDARFAWAALGLLAFLVLLHGAPAALASIAPATGSGADGRGLRRGAALVAALTLASVFLFSEGPDADRGPLSFVPLIDARGLIAWRSLFGVTLGAGLWLLGEWRPGRRGWPPAVTWTAAALATAVIYVAAGPLVRPWIDPFPAPQRISAWAISAVLLLPCFWALELGLRGPRAAGLWLPLVARALGLLVLAGLLFSRQTAIAPGALRWVALLALPMELFAFRCARCGVDARVSALVQAIWLAWPLAAFSRLDL